MEHRLASKLSVHEMKFKTDIRDWLVGNQVCLHQGCRDVTCAFLDYVYSYEGATLTEEDFHKRKRSSSMVPLSERCMAKCSNGGQCSRRRSGGSFCGTHAKGTPYGIVSETTTEDIVKRVEVRLTEINGIYYYKDDSNQVYSPEDIVGERPKPRMIGHIENGVYKPSHT